MAINQSDIPWLLQRDGAEPGIWLATITGWDGGAAERLARNTEDITSRGQVFKAAGFGVSLPADSDTEPRAGYSVPNIDREPGLALIENNAPLTVSYEMVRPSNPDVVVFAARALKMRTGNITPLEVTGELSAAQYDNEPYINLIVSPDAFPGLARMVR
jgi:hypothetical protein